MNRNLTVPSLIAAAVLLPVVCVAFCRADQDTTFDELQREFRAVIAPLVQERCADCHAGVEANAGIAFERYQTLEDVLNEDRVWNNIRRQIDRRHMPPEEAEPLSQKDRQRLTSWIEHAFRFVDESQAMPGHVTIRKLNRVEYRNTVRDLFAVDYQPANEFPGDDVGEGFDNIADVLTLPPILLEKYLDAAEAITAQAIIDPNNLRLNVSLSGASFQSDGEELVLRQDGELILLSERVAGKQIRFPAPGEYLIEVEAYGDQAGDEDVKMSLLADDRLIKTLPVRSVRRKPSNHRAMLTVSAAGTMNLQVRFDNDYYLPRAVAPQDRNLHVLSVRVRGPRPSQTAKPYLRPSGTRKDDAIAYLDQILPRLFRTQISDDLKSRYVTLFEDSRQRGESFHQSLQTVTQAALVAPQFLYKLQLPVPVGEIRSLNDFERGTALSYFVWSSTPDDELLELAKHNRLSDELIWRQQVGRLLEDTRSTALVDNFASQWLNLPLLEQLQPDPELFPTMDQQMLDDMATETKMVIGEIFRRDGSILELLQTDFSYLNRRLASHYSIEGIRSDSFQRVALSDPNRSGILTHASFLSLTSNPNRTSPARRGKWIMENIWGEEPPPALPGVVPLDEQHESTGSLAERMMKHRADPNCAVCHTTMDALGFALENFDAVGRFRLRDGDLLIEASSELPDGQVIRGAAGLRELLRTVYQERFVRCFAEKMLTYALGRGLEYYDRPTVNQIVRRAADNDFRFSQFVMGVAESEPFLKRSGPRKSK